MPANIEYVVDRVALGQIFLRALVSDDDENNNNSNNNNNYYYNNNICLLQLGCYPVAVIIVHVNKT